MPKFKKLQHLIEKHIVLEDIDPVIFYGVGNGHLQMIRSLYPKLRIMARDNVVRVLGDEEQMASFEESVEKLRAHVLRFNSLGDEDILDIIKGKRTRDDVPDGVVVYSMSGRPIKARTPNQQRLIEAYNQNDMVFAVGPAGTGKTYLSIALAVKALKDKTAKKIILSRPAVEAGEKLGFLPGDMKEKIDPYLQPLYDALEDMLPQVKLQDMMEKHIIQIAPLAFMRGRTLSDAVVILDEAQNTTPAQIRMFLTRMGWNTKMIITGDMKDKIDPYLQPLYDALEDMLPQVKLQDMMEKHVIQIAPLAFMRGRTLSDAVVILDEAQNTTPAQIRMFLTRMGWNTKMIITGDMTQIDLPHSQKSGLIEALHILNNVEGIGIVNLDRGDIVRHKLVTRIVNAYEEFDKEMKGEFDNNTIKR